MRTAAPLTLASSLALTLASASALFITSSVAISSQAEAGPAEKQAGETDQAVAKTPKKGEAGYSPVDPTTPGFRGGLYKFVPPETPGVSPVPHHADTPIAARTIYLNSCRTDNCTFTPGQNDSRENRSSIVNATSTVSPWSYDEQTWQDTVQCVSNLFAPFNVIVTDVKPEGPHHEAIVAGSPGQIGMPNGVLGVAPFSCGIIHNAITFSFADVASSVQELCSTIGQEVAHGWGLDHEFLCADPMTYLGGCGAKSFQNVDAQCGEFEARACMCGGNSQNSVTRINDVFAAGEPLPPAVTISEPAASADVEPGFAIRADIADPIPLDSVKFFVNGTMIHETRSFPFVTNAPADLAQGSIEIEVVATNMAGGESRTTVTAVHGERCSEGSCPDGQSCWSGACIDTSGDGSLGTPCADGTQCQSGLCATSGDTMLCTDECRNGECPSGFDCTPAGSTEICWPESKGGCQASGSGGGGPVIPVLIGLFGAFAFRRRRRSQRDAE